MANSEIPPLPPTERIDESPTEPVAGEQYKLPLEASNYIIEPVRNVDQFSEQPTPIANGWSAHGDNIVPFPGTKRPKEENTPPNTEPESKFVEGLLENEPYHRLNPNVEPPAQSERIPDRAHSENSEQPDRMGELKSFLTGPAKEMVVNLPDRAQRALAGMYEMVYKTPVVNRVVAKAEVAWNQMWIDRKQERAQQFSEKISGIDSEMAVLNNSEAALRNSIDILKSRGLPGTEKIERSLEQVASRRDNLNFKRAGFEDKVAQKNSSIESFVNRRTEITERMIGQYAEHMKPMEGKIENLNQQRNALEFQMGIMGVEHAEQMKELDAVQTERDTIFNALQSAGLLDKKMNHPALHQLDKIILNGKSAIAASEASAKKQAEKIEATIRTIELKAEPFRIKQREFERIQNRNNQTVEVEERGFATMRSKDNLSDNSLEEIFAENENLAESSRLTIGTLLERWNSHIKETVADKNKREQLQINIQQFLEKARWRDSVELEYEQFVKIIEGFYKMQRIKLPDPERLSMTTAFKQAKIDNA